jgi:hypothetical protein
MLMTPSSKAAASMSPRTTYARWSAFALMLLLVPSASDSQARRTCPRYARVPGYGACTNIGGIDCGFCTYKCNDDTVVRWNVCQQ